MEKEAPRETETERDSVEMDGLERRSLLGERDAAGMSNTSSAKSAGLAENCRQR